ncbi:MAG: sensor domain-containing diguanylate cyclase [Candidatus Aminicenantes bacterium]|nr:sensor domain-containing diguanylate cyclase [Candidatus Aminicenantes bacterium]
MSDIGEKDIFRRVFERSARAAAVVDRDGCIHLSNSGFQRMIPGSLLPQSILEILKMRRTFQISAEQEHARFLIIDPGTGRNQPATLTHLSGEPGGKNFFLLEFHSHFEETRLEEALQESEQRFCQLQQNLPVGIYRANRDGDLETVNDTLLRMTGYDSFSELQMAELGDVWADVRERDNLIRRLREEGAVLGYTVHLKRQDGSEFIGSFDARGNFDKEGNLVYFDTIVQDITEKVRAQEELERLATSDSLTGLANRQHLMKRLEYELKRAERYDTPLTLLMIDLDNFKQINDTRGHQAGDVVLRGFAGLVGRILREIDHAGRYGGEEFCVVLPETDLEGGIVIAERIRESVENHAFSGPGEVSFHVTCSIGVVHAESADMDELISTADRRLYEAKRSGRNRVVPNRVEELKS